MNGFYLFIRSNIFLWDKVTLFSVLAPEDVFLPLSIANTSSLISTLFSYTPSMHISRCRRWMGCLCVVFPVDAVWVVQSISPSLLSSWSGWILGNLTLALLPWKYRNGMEKGAEGEKHWWFAIEYREGNGQQTTASEMELLNGWVRFSVGTEQQKWLNGWR